MDKALHMEDVCLRYNNRNILTDFSIDIDHTDIVAICGTSGSGKDYIPGMLLRKYDGKYSLTGKLIVNGVEIELLAEKDMRYVRMMDIGVLPVISKKAALGVSVYNYIIKPFSEDMSKSKREIILDAKRVMELLGVKNAEGIMNRSMASLSRNDLRAVMYSAAISTDPSILISYGPDKDMSESETEEMYKLLVKICKIKNTAMLILTSDTKFAKRISEKMYFIKNDRLIEDNEIEHSYINLLNNAALDVKVKRDTQKGEELLKTENLFPVKGSEILDFGICRGEVKCIMGAANTVKVLMGDKKPYNGNVLIGGQNIRKIKPFDRKVFPVNHSVVMPGVDSVGECLALCAVSGGAEHRTRCSMEVQKALSTAWLPADFVSMPLKSITLFEKYKVAIACASAQKAHVMLISGIEDIEGYTERYEILSLIQSACQSEGMAAIIITQSTKIKSLLE